MKVTQIRKKYHLLQFTITMCCILVFNLLNTIQAQKYEWAIGLGDGSFDEARSVVTDDDGNVYVIGSFSGTVDFHPSTTIATLTSFGYHDAFLAKYDQYGNYIWAINLGGSSFDYGTAVAVDDSGDVLITGHFSGMVDFDPSTSDANLVSSASGEIFLAKYDDSGNYIWAKGIGGNTANSASIAAGIDGSVYMTGYFSGTADFDPSADTAALVAYSGSNKFFLAKYDRSGNYKWAKKLEGGSSDYGNAVSVDLQGNVVLTGYFYGSKDFDPSENINILDSHLGADIFITKYDDSGQYLWAKNMGGDLNAYSYSVVIDHENNIVLTGSFEGRIDFDPSSAMANLESKGSDDIFLAKYDELGNYLWAKGIGGNSNDIGWSVAVDEIQNIYVTGSFVGNADFDPSSSSVHLAASGADIFLAKYSSSGNYIWAINMGGSSGDVGWSVDVDNKNGVLIAGSFYLTADFNPYADTANLSSAGGTDIFIAKYRDTSLSGVPNDTSFILLSDNTWSLSTITTTHTANSYPWPGVMSTPPTATFTLPVDVGQPYPWEHLWTVPGSQVITSLSGVTYYRNTFELVDPSDIEARFRMFVDDNMQIFINGHWIAMEDKMGPNVWRGSGRDLVFNEDGTIDNGYAGGEPFSYVTSMPMDSILQLGTNEIILAIRNRTSRSDRGGFSFRMDLDKGSAKKSGTQAPVAKSEKDDSRLIIFPNPTTGSAKVSLNHSSQTTTEGTVSVYDFSGKLVTSQSIYSEAVLNLNSLPSGVYLVKVISGNETFTQKVVKQ